MRRRKPLRVWFNQGLSNVYDAVEIIRKADRSTQLTLLASHSRPISPLQTVARESWREPVGNLQDEEYVDWCVQTCAGREIDLFVPGRRLRAVAQRRAELERNGTRVLIAARPEILDLFDRKDKLYADLSRDGMPVADHQGIYTGEELEEACRRLGQRHARLCIKPASSVFGAGFHLLDIEDDEFERLVSSDASRVGIDAFRRAMAQARKPRPLLVMEYLPGPERSIDCLAEGGRLITAVARVKHDGWQDLEVSGAAIDLAESLTHRYELSGIFNIQTRDARGEPRVLEINPRMSGGILYSCLSGLALPYWAVLLALGLCTPDEIPAPRGGLIVTPITAAVVREQRAPELRNETMIGEAI